MLTEAQLAALESKQQDDLPVGKLRVLILAIWAHRIPSMLVRSKALAESINRPSSIPILRWLVANFIPPKPRSLQQICSMIESYLYSKTVAWGYCVSSQTVALNSSGKPSITTINCIWPCVTSITRRRKREVHKQTAFVNASIKQYSTSFTRSLSARNSMSRLKPYSRIWISGCTTITMSALIREKCVAVGRHGRHGSMAKRDGMKKLFNSTTNSRTVNLTI